MEEQAALAQAYGISGFAYYFYWFAGKVLMETPLEGMLGNPKVDIPFCMIWANENWTRRWDGQEKDILIAQDHSIEDSLQMLDYLRKFMEDDRYIKVNGKPLFVVYRPGIVPDIKATLDAWRDRARDFGFPDLYIVSAQTFGLSDPREFGFDAAMEFPPHTSKSDSIAHRMERLAPAFAGNVFDYDTVVKNAVQRPDDPFKVLPTAMLSWDNTARKGLRSHVFANFSVVRYAQWLSSNAERVAKDTRLSEDEKIVFVNAWNEWAEGTHLEPDQKHGFGYLAATRKVMENYAPECLPFLNPPVPENTDATLAVIAHVHYDHTWPDLRDAIQGLSGHGVDVFVTVTSLTVARMVSKDLPDALVELVDNRGRDIRPFIHMLKKTADLGYRAVCKVHGKASSYRSDGDALRRSALAALLTSECIDRFKADPQLGLLAPSRSLIPHTKKNLTFSGELAEQLAHELKLPKWRGSFPAGSMFWFRPDALLPLMQLDENAFDVERGLVDGTRAHAIERLFCSVCEAQGFQVATTGADSETVQPAAVQINATTPQNAGTEQPMTSREWMSGLSIDDLHQKLLAQASGKADPDLPDLPSSEIQEQFVGSSFVPAFEEAKVFYKTLTDYSKKLSTPIAAPDTRFLDFGCGWGRFLRYAMKDFSSQDLFATDVDPDIIAVCKSSGIQAQYSLLSPTGTLPFEDNFFSHAMAYSVFTHLPEHLHKTWAAEIIRVLKPGGIFCGTVETRKFLEFIQGLDDPEKHTNDWVSYLAKYQPDSERLLRDYDKGKFIYLPTGGGGVRTQDVYGEAVVSRDFIERQWKGAHLRAFIDDRFWQTVIILQKA
jgi:lipopolysaccharide biosynthesis protein/ubiquinone/menaquinone biosynthesis C-methylase UbiE